MSVQRIKAQRPAGVSFIAMFWFLFFGTLFIFNIKVAPEPFDASRRAAIGFAIVGMLALLAFLRGRRWAWSLFLILNSAAGLFILWSVCWAWVFRAPIPLGVYVALGLAILSFALLILRSTRSYFILSSWKRKRTGEASLA